MACSQFCFCEVDKREKIAEWRGCGVARCDWLALSYSFYLLRDEGRLVVDDGNFMIKTEWRPFGVDTYATNGRDGDAFAMDICFSMTQATGLEYPVLFLSLVLQNVSDYHYFGVLES